MTLKEEWRNTTWVSIEIAILFQGGPVVLKYVEHFWDFAQAEAREKELKRWSRRKKEALIAGDWERLKEYAKRTG